MVVAQEIVRHVCAGREVTFGNEGKDLRMRVSTTSSSCGIRGLSKSSQSFRRSGSESKGSVEDTTGMYSIFPSSYFAAHRNRSGWDRGDRNDPSHGSLHNSYSMKRTDH